MEVVPYVSLYSCGSADFSLTNNATHHIIGLRDLHTEQVLKSKFHFHGSRNQRSTNPDLARWLVMV